MSKADKCPYDLVETKEQEDAMAWLQHMLGQMTCSRHPSAKTAAVAHQFVGKLLSTLHKQHSLLHEKDMELQSAETVMKGLLQVDQMARDPGPDDMN